MGTRADFYMGRGESTVWLGSIAWDGYPDGIEDKVLKATTGDEYLKALGEFWQDREDVTLPDMGWPWPWDTSHTTDWAYAFDNGKVWASSFGEPWVDPLADQEEPDYPIFPDMSDESKVTFGPRSGLMVITPDGLAG